MKSIHLSAVALVCLVAAAFAQGPAAPQNSVAYQINPGHTGAMQTSGLTLPLAVKWSVTLNGTASYPLIIPGEVIVIDGGNGTVPSTLEALDASTGAVLWSQPVASGFGPWVGAAYDNGKVFAVNYDTPGFSSGSMSAFSATTGQELWTSSLDGQYLFTSAPTAMNGIVYTGGAGVGGTVYAVAENNGQVLWTGSVENGDTSSPAVVGTGVYVSYACPQTYRFNAKSGTQVWHYSGECEGGGGNTAEVYQGLVYVRNLYNFSTTGITLNATTGALVGNGFNSNYAPAFLGNVAFYTGTNTLTAVSLTSGSTLWTATVSSSESLTCAPVVVNGVVYTGTSTGALLGYSASTGKQKFSKNLGQPISCSEYFAIPQAGMGAGQGLLVVPAGTEVFAFQ